jgi:hypothetical protein
MVWRRIYYIHDRGIVRRGKQSLCDVLLRMSGGRFDLVQWVDSVVGRADEVGCMWRDSFEGWGRVVVVVVVGDEIVSMEGRGCGREFDRVDVGDGGGGMEVDKMGFEGRMRWWMHKWRRWTVDGTACEGMESNTVAVDRGRGIEGFGVLEELDIVVDGTVVLVVAVAVVDAVVVVVASG